MNATTYSMTLEAESVYNFLIENGYKEHPAPTNDRDIERCFSKYVRMGDGRFHTHVNMWDLHNRYANTPRETAIDIYTCYELPEGEWVKVQFYGMRGEDFKKKLKRLEEQSLMVFNSLKGLVDT